MNIQMSINHNGALNRALREGQANAALRSAEKLATYQPLDPAQHVRLGFVAYLAGQADRALAAFARAKQLTLPAQFKAAWDTAARNAAFQKVIDDTAFVAKVFAASAAPQ
jgi:hypothetical protein